MDQQAAPVEMIAARLRLILHGLRSVLGLWRLDGAVVVRVSAQAGRAFGQIERMLLRFRAGTLRAPVLRPMTHPAAPPATPPATHSDTPTAKVARTRRMVLPRKFGWLVMAGKHQAAGYASQLQHLMAEPEMAALLEACPRARQILRPLCRALAIELSWTVTPQRPRKPRAPRPKPPPYRWPYPRGAVSAARRSKALENALRKIRASFT